MTVTRKELYAATKSFAELIRQYVRDQHEAVWQKVPWLALSAAKLGVATVEINRAYTFGYWHVSPTLAVDCATGEIVKFSHERPIPAADVEVLEYANCLQKFDGDMVVIFLKRAALAELMTLLEDDVEERRVALDEEREKLGLTPRYKEHMRQPLPPPDPSYVGNGD